MEVILDGQANFELQGDPQDAFAAVVAVEEYLNQNGRGMLSIKADGKDVSPANLIEELQGKALDQVSTLEIDSQEISALVDICLKELEDVLPELPKACHSLAEVFHGEAPETGYEPFQQLAEIWHNVKTRQQQIFSMLGLDTGSIELDGVSFAKMHEELNKFLNEAAEALEVCDNVCLGDLLEYELAPRSESEEKIVELLRQQAEERLG